MILLFLLVQWADLLSFLVAVIAFPALLEYEIGLIKVIYSNFGMLGATVWKGGGAFLAAWAFSKYCWVHPNVVNVLAVVGIVLGLVGTVFNTIAFWSQVVGG
jgi:hypothetical protein